MAMHVNGHTSTDMRRVLWVRQQQRLARSALFSGHTDAAREMMRVLRITDFERTHRAEIHLGVLRDRRSELTDVAEAVNALTLLAVCA
jgi:hypothetical protein